MLDKLIASLENPGIEFRSAPFFGLNARLEPEEMRRHMRVFAQMGLGGCFFHSRIGLDNLYLGKEYMDCIRAGVEECRKLGIAAWLYDEDRWPSGAAGGLVTRDPRWRGRYLAENESDGTEVDADDELTVAYFALQFSGETVASYRRISADEALLPGERRFRYYRKLYTPEPWYNDQTYLDTFNPEAVAEFIRITHEAYYREFGADFGGVIPGIFSDEPTYSRNRCLPWTDKLPEYYAEKNSDSLVDQLPELFHPIGGAEFSAVRLRYFNTITACFIHAFMEQIYRWCDAHHLQFTGHLLGEDSVTVQTMHCGAAMRGYEFEHIPGIDVLTEHWNIFDTAKQCTSVAHQLGRPRRMSETYGCTGWDFPFFGHKAIGDWQYALGINFRCQHLAWYSMQGESKRDYPGCISYQVPWWKYHHHLENYFARIGAALAPGEEVRDILVIHPLESTWGVFIPKEFTPERSDAEDEALVKLRNTLLGANLDYDYGDEEMMSRLAAVENSDEPKLRVGQARYKVVVVPKLRTIRSSTLNLLSEFAAAGGEVIYLDEVPPRLDGESSAFPAEVFARFRKTTLRELPMAAQSGRRISITDPAGKEIEPALSLLKQSGDEFVLFICNTGVDFKYNDIHYPGLRERLQVFPDAKVTVRNVAPGTRVWELEPATNTLTTVDFTRDEAGNLHFSTALEWLGSRLFLIGQGELPAIAPRPAGQVVAVQELTAPWHITPSELNPLVLDIARYRIDDEEFADPDYILAIDLKLRARLGMPRRGRNMVQPWYARLQNYPKISHPLDLEYEFAVDELPEGPLFLALEQPEKWRITLNGASVEFADAGFWCDRSLRLTEISPAQLRVGGNLLTLHADYGWDLGLEAIYLLGTFATEKDRISAAKLPQEVPAGDLGKFGFANYSGNIDYETIFECEKEPGKRVKLEIPAWQGIGMMISLNGGAEKFLAWAPFEVDLTDDLKSGKNQLKITLLGSRRNSLGPFYCKDAVPELYAYSNFFAYDHAGRNLVPFGLLASPRLRVEK